MDTNQLTPYLAGGFALAIGWLFKTCIQFGKDIAVILYYMERQTKDAAIRLERVTNPTPPEMQVLLQKYRHDSLDKDERGKLIDWLKTLDTNPDADPAERSAALQLLTGFEVKDIIKPRRKWWPFA